MDMPQQVFHVAAYFSSIRAQSAESLTEILPSTLTPFPSLALSDLWTLFVGELGELCLAHREKPCDPSLKD